MTPPGATHDPGGKITRNSDASAPIGQAASRRARSSIDVLPSGSLRIRVYAGQDVLTGKQHYISEVVKPGPHAQELAEQAKHRLVDEIHADRHVKTHGSVVQLIEEHLKIAEIEETTKDAYRANLCKHIKPQIPAGPAASITAHTIEKVKANCAAAATTATVAPRSSTTARRADMRARRSAGSTCASRWRSRRSARSCS